MIYTDQQFEELAQYEDRFQTAVFMRYARALPSGALERICQIHNAATGSRLRANGSCADCIKRVLRAVGVSYFTDKDARRVAAQQAKRKSHEVAVSEETPATEVKAVKTEENAPKKATKKTTAKKTADKPAKKKTSKKATNK